MPHKDVGWNDMWGDSDDAAYHQQYSEYMDTIQDARTAYDMINDYRWSESGKMRAGRVRGQHQAPANSGRRAPWTEGKSAGGKEPIMIRTDP